MITKSNFKYDKILLVSTLITASQCWASYRTAQSQLQRRNFMAAAPEFYKVYTSQAQEVKE